MLKSGELGVDFGGLFRGESDSDSLAGDRGPKDEVPHVVVGLTRSEDEAPALGKEFALVVNVGHVSNSFPAS
jgi:hypothetical protein